MKKTTAITLLAATLMLLCGCGPGQPSTASPAAAPTTALSKSGNASGSAYSDAKYGFAIAIPAGMQLRHDFQRSYLGDASWKAFAGPDDHGAPVLALVLDGSNQITAAELRIGIGTDSDALAHCSDVPASGAAPASDTTTLAGVPFTHFHAADAAMSHYLEVESYRAVHAGRCYAVDLLLTGTRPEVYDPPATPPFARTDAQQRLHEALNGFRFLP
ncbi:hypothetical protein ACPPVV_10890 [Rhodanobacter sp. Col0626]|uniref:hypothetical protein n=1 Tax=Rhodanobacter sp. Col0626 TaxID=3415679 RepID=UPI003CF34F18